MAEYRLPEWLDRRSVEWSADTLDAVAARLLQRWPAAVERRIGVEAAACTLRALLLTGKPALPANANTRCPCEAVGGCDGRAGGHCHAVRL